MRLYRGVTALGAVIGFATAPRSDLAFELAITFDQVLESADPSELRMALQELVQRAYRTQEGPLPALEHCDDRVDLMKKHVDFRRTIGEGEEEQMDSEKLEELVSITEPQETTHSTA